MSTGHGWWMPCGACKGCNDEFTSPSEVPPEAIEYCSSAKWMPDKTACAAKKPAKKRVRKLSKKAQLWANYNKQQDDTKKENFFKPRKPKAPAPPPGSNPKALPPGSNPKAPPPG